MKHKLKVNADEKIQLEISQKIIPLCKADEWFTEEEFKEHFNRGEYFFYLDDVLWDTYLNDLCEISAAYPNVIFILKTSDWDLENCWRCYFLEGKYEYCYPIITTERFDPKRLKAPEPLNEKEAYNAAPVFKDAEDTVTPPTADEF